MNGNSRLYRSASEAMVGGVAAGLGNYFKIDPTLVRLAFIVLTFVTGGAFILVYLALWLLIPTAGSTATEPAKIVQENLNDLGAKVRGFTGSNPAGSGNPADPTANGGAQYNQPQPPQASVGAPPRVGIGPIVLIGLGIVLLLGNLGLFHTFAWRMWWPLLLIGLGVIILSRRRY